MLIKSVAGMLLLAMLLAGSLRQAEAQQDAYGWYWLNGQPQGNDIFWTGVIDASNIVATTSRGGFMKSSDGGDTWTITQAGAFDLSSTGGLSRRALNTGWFFDANTGIVGGAPEVGSAWRTVISKTTDGGVTWSFREVNGNWGGTINDMYFINSTTGFLCGGSNANAFKTTDAGETWIELASVPQYTYNSVFAFNANKIILTTYPSKLVISTDGGNSWTEQDVTVTGTNTTFKDIYFKDANTGYITGAPNFFAYSTNGGSTWTKSNSSSIRSQYALAYDNGVVWTAGDYEYVYKSSNNGVTWDSVRFQDNSNINQPFPYITYGLGVRGNDLIVGGTAGRVTTSNDGGSTWRNKNYTVDPLNVYYSSIHVDSPTGNIWIGTGTSGIGSMLYSSNGGANWSVMPNSMNNPVYCIEFTTSNTAYICGGNAFSFTGQMSKSTDGGMSWTALSFAPPISTYQFNAVEFVNSNTGWVGGVSAPGTPPLIAKTTNGGTTWVEQSLETNPQAGVAAITMIDANTGYLLSNSLYSTTNGGTNWVKTTNATVLSKGWTEMSVVNKDVLFLCGSHSSGTKMIIKSTDAGMSWTDISSNLLNTVTLFNTDWLNPYDGVVSGTNGFCAITTNGGLSWTQTNPGFSTTVDVEMPAKNVWYSVSDRNGQYQVGRKYEANTTISVNIAAGIEGFWNGSSQVVDTVTLQLRNSVSPYGSVASKKAVLTSGIGYGSFDFSGVSAGSYYIAVKHRNSIETWSSAPVAVVQGGNYDYSFTNSASQSYGSNAVLKLGRYCFYSGDVNQDGAVDATDYSQIDNDAFNFVSGYAATDVTGDNTVDASDASIVDNNAFGFVGKITP